LLAVSHDRQFLNRTVQTIIEIREHSRELKQYTGNYDAYQASKTLERARWKEEYERQQEDLKELRLAMKTKARQVGYNRPARDADKITHKFFGERVQRTVSRNVRSMEERLRRIEENPIPQPPEELRISPDFDPHVLEGKVPLIASGLSKSFDGRRILHDVSFAIGIDDRIVLLGPNGAGKSTLLKILAGLESPDSGDVIRNPSAKIGYLDQEQETLDLDAKVSDAYSHGLVGREEELFSDLFRYGFFTYEDVIKKVRELSIGQRRKLQIARLITERANLLLLDEPTNHISFDVLEEFEKALLKFAGPIIAVSHDRWFIQRFSQVVWELRDGQLIQRTDGFEGYRAAIATKVAEGGAGS
jgi:macrolide transport system ATP-binding/permease protein